MSEDCQEYKTCELRTILSTCNPNCPYHLKKGIHDPNVLYDMAYAMSQTPCTLTEWINLARWIKTHLVNKYGQKNFRVKYINAILKNKDWAIESMYRDGLRFLMHSEILGETENGEKGHSSWLNSVKRRIEAEDE